MNRIESKTDAPTSCYFLSTGVFLKNFLEEALAVEWKSESCKTERYEAFLFLHHSQGLIFREFVLMMKSQIISCELYMYVSVLL